MITDKSCGARLDVSAYHDCCILSPRHSGPHCDGLYYWETGKTSEREAVAERAAKVLGLVSRHGPPRGRLSRRAF
jgi:hypothetical protein